VVEEKGLKQESDLGALEALCQQAIDANPKAVAEYRAGKAASINFLKGQVMKLSHGKANPNKVSEILLKKLAELPPS
jgi:aspartyl-tRNA(Asn)/glutamyl-tRNA(Gln) amidotransferase subunit B